MDGDYWLRVSSLDKKFVVAYALGLAADSPPVVSVSGAEFPGIDRGERRPVWLVAPELSAGSGGSLGPWVEQLPSWSFDPDHQITRTGPPRFAGMTRRCSGPEHPANGLLRLGACVEQQLPVGGGEEWFSRPKLRQQLPQRNDFLRPPRAGRPAPEGDDLLLDVVTQANPFL